MQNCSKNCGSRGKIVLDFKQTQRISMNKTLLVILVSVLLWERSQGFMGWFRSKGPNGGRRSSIRVRLKLAYLQVYSVKLWEA